MAELHLSSSAFASDAAIPRQYTCDGRDISPPLRIAGVPAGTRSLALVVDDPDAPRGTFTHWLIWNLPPDVQQLHEGLRHEPRLPELGDARQGTNDFRSIGFRGPCPPAGVHHYRFTLYASDAVLDLPERTHRAQLEEALKAHTIASTELIGTYGRG